MLVGSYPLNSPATLAAGMRLAQRFGDDVGDAAFREKYSRAATAAYYADDSVFQIHKDKFADPLVQLLDTAGLVWKPSRPNRGDWFAVHPVVGEIIMSTAAVTAANDKGYDILTDTERDHRVAANRSEEAIYEILLGRTEKPDVPRRTQSSEIGELVLATTFDLSKLTADDFAALSNEREAVFDFRRLLADRAKSIPAMGDHDERLRRAKDAAQQILDEWESKRLSWKGFLKRAFRLEAAGEAKDAAAELLSAAVFGTAGSALLGVVPGLAVGFTYYGAKVWRDLKNEERESPTRFLSRVVQQRGGTLAAACAPAPL